jgi:hypothetical protein
MKRAIYSLPFLFLLAASVPQEAHAQIRFESDYIFFNRTNDAEGTQITGPGSFSADDHDFGYDSGYRFTLGGTLSEVDIEASFFAIPEWSSSESGVLGLPLVFDDPTNAFVAPANGLGFNSGLGIAANVAGLEDDEIEFLEAGAQVRSQYTSRLDSFELNIGSNRYVRPVYFAVGWRHFEVNEDSRMTAVGDFQALDALTGLPPGAAAVGNDGLSADALDAAGFDNLPGTPDDGFLGYDPTLVPPVITTLGYIAEGRARNNLDGVQVTLGGRYSASQMVTIDGFIKGGVYQNEALGVVRETLVGVANDDSVYQLRISDRNRTASFGAGIGFNVGVALTDYISLKYGYEAIFLTNMAFGPDQSSGLKTDILGNTRFSVVNNGLFIAHGGNIGLEVGW